MPNTSFTRTWPFLALVLIAGIAALWWWTRPPGRPTPPPVATAQPPAAPVAPEAPVPSEPTTPAPPLAPDRPEAALDLALGNADPGLRAREFGQLFYALVQRDPEAALAYLRRMPRSSVYSQSLFMVLDAISRRDVDRALDLARELARSQEDRAFYSALFDRLARENLSGAIQRLAAVPAGTARENAVRALTDAWVRMDPAAALAWAQQLADPADRSPAVETALRDLAERDPLRAVDLALKSMTGGALERTLSRALQQLTTTDPDAAARLIALLPPGDMQTYSAVNVARVLAERSVESALAWINSLPIELTQWIVRNNVLTTWAQKDLLAAARYVADMPPGGGLDFAAGHMGTLMAVNPRDAILWAESLPRTARDAALISIASAWAQREPAEAVRWAVTLQGEPLRTNAIGGAYSYWQMLDHTAAGAWLQKADLPPDLKAKIGYRER